MAYRLETMLIVAAVVLLLLVGNALVNQRQVDLFAPPLLDWQVSAFYDMDDADQAIYNAMSTASVELWWIHGDLLAFADPEVERDPWPTIAELEQDYLLPPFTKDVAWSQHGRVNWQRVASYSFEGSTVYHGSGGTARGQSAYLVMLSHMHKGASYTNGATIWVHLDPNAPPPSTIKRDSLIINGWKEVVPYSGAMEVDRLKGG